MKIEINDDTLDEATCFSLKRTYDALGEQHVIPIFSYDPEVEKRKVKKLRKAIKRAHNWYSTSEGRL
jgi:hypothetical protein